MQIKVKKITYITPCYLILHQVKCFSPISGLTSEYLLWQEFLMREFDEEFHLVFHKLYQEVYVHPRHVVHILCINNAKYMLSAMSTRLGSMHLVGGILCMYLADQAECREAR